MKSKNNKLIKVEKGQRKLTKTEKDIYENIRVILTEARSRVAVAVNVAMVSAYWEIGRQITEAIGERAEYGATLIKYISDRLKADFGNGFGETTVKLMRKFYLTFPIRHTLCAELSWSHYRLLIRIEDIPRREYYIRECIENSWSVRQLERQINSFYYERLLATPEEGRESVRGEVEKAEPKKDILNILKDPYILEFIGLKENRVYLESE